MLERRFQKPPTPPTEDPSPRAGKRHLWIGRGGTAHKLAPRPVAPSDENRVLCEPGRNLLYGVSLLSDGSIALTDEGGVVLSVAKVLT